jgi:hypothetical protein
MAGSVEKVLSENKDVLERLERQLASTYRVIPFVGAGISMQFGCPGWSGFLRDISDRIGKRARVDALLAEQDFEGAADFLVRTYGAGGFQGEIERCFGPAVARDRELDGVFTLLPELTAGPIVTTNFDQLIERVFVARDTPLKVLRGGDLDTASRSLGLLDRFLLKIHGDAEERTGRVLTRKEYDNAYGATGKSRGREVLALPGLLHRLMVGQVPMLFLGCSLAKDRTLTILARAYKRSAESLTHFAFVQTPKEASELPKRRLFLSKFGISPIWYPRDEHALIPAVLTELLARLRRNAPANAAPAVSKTELEARIDGRIDELRSRFVGRTAELESLDKEIASATGRVLVVTAEGGRGKSALLAAVVDRHRRNKKAVAAHFFSRRDGITSVTEAYDTLTSQVRRALGTRTDGELTGGRTGLYRAMQDWSSKSKEPLLLVVDGLDEADGLWQQPGPSKLPPQVTLLVSARAADDEAPPDLSDWLREGQRFSLGPLQRADVAALLASHPEPALRREANRVVDWVMAATSGLALHVELLLDDLAQEATLGKKLTAASVKRGPKGFDTYVASHLREMIRDRSALGQARTKKVFALLCVARGPIGDADLQACTGASALELPWRVTRWFSSRREPNGEISHRFCHDRLAPLFARDLSGPIAQAEKALLTRCGLWSENRSVYALRFYAEHLAAARNLEKLRELAGDVAFREAQLAAFPEEPRVAVTTLEHALFAHFDAGDLPGAAQMLLGASDLSESVRGRHPPLEAVMAGSTARALALAELGTPLDRVLWQLLTCWELAKTDRASAASDILQRLANESLPEARGWRGRLAVLMLAQLTFAADSWRTLVRKLLGFRDPNGDDPRSGALAELLIVQGELDAAQTLASGRELESLARGYVRAGNYEQAAATAKALSPHHREQRFLLLTALAIERGSLDRAREWLEESRRQALADRAGYAARLLGIRAGLELALALPDARATLEQVADEVQRACALAEAARLTALRGGNAAALWNEVDSTRERIPEPERRAGALAAATRAAAGVDHERVRRYLNEGTDQAETLKTYWEENPFEAVDFWTKMARAAAAAGELGIATSLLRNVPAQLVSFATDTFAELVAADETIDDEAKIERAMTFVDEERSRLGPRFPSPAEYARVMLPTLARMARGTEAARARVLVAGLLQPVVSESARRLVDKPLGAIVSLLLKKERVSEAEQIVESIRDDFIRDHYRSEVAIARARSGDLSAARKFLERAETSAVLRDPVSESVVGALAARNDIADAKAAHAKMAWGTEQWFGAKMQILAATARTEGVTRALEELKGFKSTREMSGLAGLVNALAPDESADALWDCVLKADNPNMRLGGLSELAVACTAVGRAEAARDFFSAAEAEAAEASKNRDTVVSRAESAPWLRLAIALARAGELEESGRIFRETLRRSYGGYDHDENRLAFVKGLVDAKQLDEAFGIAQGISSEPKLRDALTAIAFGTPPAPADFTEYVDDHWKTLREGGLHCTWAADIWSALGDRTRLRDAIATRPLDHNTAESLCCALVRLAPDLGVSIAKALLRELTEGAPSPSRSSRKRSNARRAQVTRC